MKKQDPLQQAVLALMDSLTDATEWQEKRIALYDKNDKFVALLPSNTHYGAVASLCRRFHVTDRIVNVTVIFREEEE